jgi:hypothetical protein
VFSNFENRAAYEIMWKNIIWRGRPQMTIWRTRIACWIHKATLRLCNITAFPLRQWLQERATLLRYTYVACLVLVPVSNFNLLKPTDYVTHHQFNIQQLYAVPTHCVYVFCIYLRTNSDLCHWLVFITELKSVYSAVRTGYLNKAVCASSLKG